MTTMTEERTDARSRAIDLAIGQIEKQFGRGAIMRLGEQNNLEIESIPTGSLALDLALGIGGMPRGRITEIFGPESSGKSTLCQHIIAEAQKLGGLAAYIDVEHALDPTYARAIGVKVEDLLVSQPDTGEQALEICRSAGPLQRGRHHRHRQRRRARAARRDRGRDGRLAAGPAGAPHVAGAAQAHRRHRQVDAPP